MKDLFKRVAKLEHHEVIVGGMSPMAQFEAAWEQSCLKLTGRSYHSSTADDALWERIANDLDTRYIPKLSNADLAALKAEFAGMLSDADMGAMKQNARRCVKETCQSRARCDVRRPIQP